MKKTIQITFICMGILCGQTTEQIKQAKEFIKQTGISENQIRKEAKERGYSDKQINDAMQREAGTKNTFEQSIPESIEKTDIKALDGSSQTEEKQSIVGDNNPGMDEESSTMVEDKLDIIDELELNIDSEGQPLKGRLNYFGYDIFEQDPAIFQATSIGAVDPDYLIGPGDDIIVMLWGETQFRQLLKVDREGFVFIPEIGQVFVNGLNLNLLESKLFRVFSQSYASLNPQNRAPTTFLDVSLGNLRPLRVQVLGEVAQPGAYTLSPSATLFSSLYYFNGPTTLGSLRDIQLIRAGEKIASIDFYDYLLKGKKLKDQKLQLDDIIFIPSRLKTVTIEGAINRSGIYEVKPNEDLADLIMMAGDLKITAYLDRAQIDRIIPFKDREDLGMDRMYTDVNLGQILNSDTVFPIQDGDQIQIFSVLDLRQNVVDLRGAVTRPGIFDLGDSLKLSELINKADGLMGDAYMERVDIVRIRPDFTEELIKLNLEKALDGDLNNDISLKGMDQVRVYGMTEMVPKKYVSIKGHVKRPGRFPLQKNMTLYDLIFMGGGFLDAEFKKHTYLNRADLVRNNSFDDNKKIIPFDLALVLENQGAANMELNPSDEVVIYSTDDIEGATQFVELSGHVKRPGTYELYEENMKISDLLFRGGGFDDPLFKSRTFLERADLIRYDNDRITRSIIPFNLGHVISNKNNDQNIVLLPGDEIKIYSESVFNTVKFVSINGVIKNPGTYELKTGMTLKDLILDAGGLEENVYRYRVEVGRINPLNKDLNQYAEVIILNMDEKFGLFYSNSESNIKGSFSSIKESTVEFNLEPYDLVSVRPDPYFRNQKKVKISGEVLYPGEYTILTSNEKITDVIERAGGLLPNAYADASQYFRNGVKINISLANILKKKNSNLNFKVQDADEIIILPRPNLININGEVNTPGIHKYVPGKHLRYYLRMSGGLNPNADKNNIWVEYPNGDSKKYYLWSLFSPKITDGSSIVVGTKEAEEPFDRTEYAKELTSILANLAQAISILVIATR